MIDYDKIAERCGFLRWNNSKEASAFLKRFAAEVTDRKDKEIEELYEMCVKQAKTIKEYQQGERND